MTMIDVDAIVTFSDEGKAPRVFNTLTSGRINHYNDVVEMMVRTGVEKFKAKHNKKPSTQAVNFYRKELTRLILFDKKLEFAHSMELREVEFLKG
jgi:hypothetical protein